MVPLSDLGERICILGPSNSGKSTLACAIARATGAEAIHLDRLHHLPGTDWVPRLPGDFQVLHDRALAGPRWVMDGNYSWLLPQRLQRATGLILLDLPAGVSLFRYVRRSLFERERAGALEGGRDSVKWEMVRHILLTTPKNRKRYRELFREVRLPKILLSSRPEIASCYQAWHLHR